jgi:hypothetical protein
VAVVGAFVVVEEEAANAEEEEEEGEEASEAAEAIAIVNGVKVTGGAIVGRGTIVVRVVRPENLMVVGIEVETEIGTGNVVGFVLIVVEEQEEEQEQEEQEEVEQVEQEMLPGLKVVTVSAKVHVGVGVVTNERRLSNTSGMLEIGEVGTVVAA